MNTPRRHPAALDSHDLMRDCTTQASRSGGPGGQHRNKVQTAVRLVHKPTGVSGSATERRSREQNRRVALFRLRVNLALAVRSPLDTMRGASELWRSRCHGGSVSINPNHQDFPNVLAEALDMVASCDADIKAAAEALDCTATQLVRMLKMEPRALEWVNHQRADRGLHPLR